MELFRIDNAENFLEGIKKTGFIIGRDGNSANFEIYCPTCANLMRHKVEYLGDLQSFKWGHYNNIIGLSDKPANFKCECPQCLTVKFAMLFTKNDTPQVVIIYADSDSFGTPNTPKEVNYYLDQAQKSHNMGANSASVAMFRAALEQLLYNQGFTNGMLGQKLKDLEKEIDNPVATTPLWVKSLDIEFLEAIKELGNTSIHTNGGNIEAQEKLDSDLVSALQITFFELIDRVYEQPIRTANRKAQLQAAITKKP